MAIRKYILAGKWYPDNKSEMALLLGNPYETAGSDDHIAAAIVPHAGWYYSGKTAAPAVRKLCAGKDLIVIIGGHLPAGYPVLAAFDDEAAVPGGSVRNRVDLADELSEVIDIREDGYTDNTVEVVLAMAAYYAPETEFLLLRAPPDGNAIILGKEIFRLSEKMNIKTGILASTDLTHYGSNYNFSPAGTGKKALEWVKEVNDGEIIQLMLNMEPEKILEHAEKNRSACSAGAAAAAVSFSILSGAEKGYLEDYTTSWDTTPSESFVGYAAVTYKN